jgi:hypothetical protein
VSDQSKVHSRSASNGDEEAFIVVVAFGKAKRNLHIKVVGGEAAAIAKARALLRRKKGAVRGRVVSATLQGTVHTSGA